MGCGYQGLKKAMILSFPPWLTSCAGEDVNIHHILNGFS